MAYALFVKRDLDGFFGLFIDNLVQILLIVSLCSTLCGMTGENSRFICAHSLLGAAVSIVIGNLFYAWQAHRLAGEKAARTLPRCPTASIRRRS